MAINTPSSILHGLLAISLITGTTVGSARAGDVCVVCTAPAASYRCVVDDAAGSLPPAGRLACITALARDGGHETCAVRSGLAASACDGPVRRVAMPDGSAGPLPVPVVPQSEVKAAEPGSKPPPKSVEELARQVTKSSGDQLKSTGTTISEAARKTWGCVTSFFKSC